MTPLLNETGRLTAVLMKHARDAFVSQRVIDAQWQALNFTAPPDFARAVDEYDAFLEIITRGGAEMSFLPRNDRLNLDSIYTRDASVICAEGVVLCSMGKPQRRAEPAVQEQELRRVGWPIAGPRGRPGASGRRRPYLARFTDAGGGTGPADQRRRDSPAQGGAG